MVCGDFLCPLHLWKKGLSKQELRGMRASGDLHRTLTKTCPGHGQTQNGLRDSASCKYLIAPRLKQRKFLTVAFLFAASADAETAVRVCDWTSGNGLRVSGTMWPTIKFVHPLNLNCSFENGRTRSIVNSLGAVGLPFIAIRVYRR